MKEVNVYFSNIQSHERTEFKISPGANFILSDDNNVGKSTIFEIFKLLGKLPNIDGRELNGLVRSGCTVAYANFKYDEESITLWVHRVSEEQAKAFFERTYKDGQIIRTSNCPKELIDALGILLDENRDAINFNDADSVQLVVKDSAETDKILARVLIDEHVEKIKSNLNVMDKESGYDYRYIKEKRDNCVRIKSQLTYNAFAEDFMRDKPLLECIAGVLDGGLGRVEPRKRRYIKPSLEELDVSINVATILNSINLERKPYGTITAKELDKLDALIHITSVLGELSSVLSLPSKKIDIEKITFLSGLITFATQFWDIVKITNSQHTLAKTLNSMKYEIEECARQLEREQLIVECPIRGKVWYSAETCTPVGE